MASVIQAQICEDVDSIPEYLSNPNPNNIALQMIANDFNMIPDLPVAFGGVVTSLDVTILDQEASEDEVLRNHIIDGSVPTIDTIYRYMSLIYRNGRYTPECHIIGLVFINRITAVHHLPLTMLNWRSLWLVAIILAQKVWDDRPLRTSTFSKIIPSFSKQHLRKLEANALHLLQYLTNVKPSLYAKYYFELRDLFTEIMGFQQSEWGVKPLNMAQGKQLESRFDLCSNYYNGIVLGKSNGDKMLMPKKSHANQASNVSKDVVVHNALDGKIRLSNMNDGVHSVEDSTDANMTSHNNIANGYIERRVEENELISNLFDCLDNSGDEVEMESFSEISPSSVSSNAVANTNKDSVPIDNTVTVTDCYNRLSVTTTNTVADGVHMIPIPNPTYMSMLSLNEKLRAKHADDMEKSDAADADWSDDEEDDSGYKFRLNTMKNTLNKVIENNNVSDNNSTNLNTADTHTGATAKPSSETANMIPTSSYPNPMSTASDKNLQQHSNVGSKNTVMYSNASRVTTPSVTPLRTPGPLSQSQTLEDYHYQRTPKASYHVLRF